MFGPLCPTQTVATGSHLENVTEDHARPGMKDAHASEPAFSVIDLSEDKGLQPRETTSIHALGLPE
jgi:hypothetical protein